MPGNKCNLWKSFPIFWFWCWSSLGPGLPNTLWAGMTGPEKHTQSTKHQEVLGKLGRYSHEFLVDIYFLLGNWRDPNRNGDFLTFIFFNLWGFCLSWWVIIGVWSRVLMIFHSRVWWSFTFQRHDQRWSVHHLHHHPCLPRIICWLLSCILCITLRRRKKIKTAKSHLFKTFNCFGPIENNAQRQIGSIIFPQILLCLLLALLNSHQPVLFRGYLFILLSLPSITTKASSWQGKFFQQFIIQSSPSGRFVVHTNFESLTPTGLHTNPSTPTLNPKPSKPSTHNHLSFIV